VRRSIATVSLSGTLEEKLAAAARAGFDGVELFETDLITSPLSPVEVRSRANDLGLSVDLYQPFRDFEAVPAEAFKRNLRRAERKFEVMEQLGAATMLVCSNVSEDAIEDDALAAEQLRELAARASERGLRIAYEALAWGRHVRDYDHSWRIVAEAGHPHLGVCLDSFHILSRRTDPGGIRDIPGEKIFFLQLADAPHLVMDVLQWSRHYRCFPGQGGFDLGTFLARVLDAGYEGPLSLEVFNDVFRQADADRMAVDAMRSLLILEESVRSSRVAEATRRVDLCELPAPPALGGYAFVELAVDSLSAPDTERLLTAMGFAHAGQHRSKPVQLWQQAGIHVLVNRAEQRDADQRGSDPRVVAIALESADPARSAQRAESLLAPVLSRKRGRDEADLSAIAAPDGTSVFFCRTDAADAASWLGDFIMATQAGPPLATGLTRIDHVALSQPFDYFDEAALFYRSVLGLQPRESQEVATPDGLVRSRAVTSRDGSIRLALNVPLVGKSGASESAELQHVAFACGDVLLAARSLRDRGVPLLPISGNYYEDLAARTDLERSLIDSMRELDVLYDRSDSGEFFHFYTAMVGSRLFFEIVERRASYDGYGAANSPTRMAAQRELATPAAGA
jgi:4-hydroxyphenylpyruvate dioxygenase